MKLIEILETYDPAVLDLISADKVDEAITLRLPQSIVIQEIISALSSQSYVFGKIQYGKPPTFAILNTILQSEQFTVPVDGFKERVLAVVTGLTLQAEESKVSKEKNAQLYTKVLRKSWENDAIIDKSEAHILELLKQELGIWDREHYVLMHHSSILGMWSLDTEFFQARNLLLSSGILLSLGESYVIAEEVAMQIKRAFGIEIMDDSYFRLLNRLTREDLSLLSASFQLNISGTKDAIIQRLLSHAIPPSELLAYLSVEALREACRASGAVVSGTKQAVIDNLISFFDSDKDLQSASPIPAEIDPVVKEEREMEPDHYRRMLMFFSAQQLYDILIINGMPTSGSKEDKVSRILNSHLGERSIFNTLRKEDLVPLCRRYSVSPYGAKQEVISKLMEAKELPTVTVATQQPAIAATAPPLVDVIPPEAVPVAPEEETLPPLFEAINDQFPELHHGEKIILALLKQAKSLSEFEIERVVVRHKLKWVLSKAHMTELIAKLKRLGSHTVQIKSVQNTNIYQWNPGEEVGSGLIEKKAARDIVDAVRNGVVPSHHLGMLMVGQQAARDHLATILMEVSDEKSHFKFIRGQYGSGKTFLCSWLKEYALDNEFVVSFINISHDQPLSDLPIFYSGLVAGLRTPEKLDSSALADIIESWLFNVTQKAMQIEGTSLEEISETRNLTDLVQNSIEIELASMNEIEAGFSQAVRGFYDAKIAGDSEKASNALAWITGSRALSAQALRDLGVKGNLEAHNVFSRMRALLELIGGARYKGLLLVVDELELVRKFPHARQREQALETLRLLIDEAGRNALPNCLLIFTGTDEFFEDERYGLKSYEALAERVLSTFSHESFVSMRQPIIALESLDKSRLGQVVLKLRDLHGIAYNWDVAAYADDQTLFKLLDEWTMFGDESVDRKPRPILRELIQRLDICEENRGVNLAQFLQPSRIEISPASD